MDKVDTAIMRLRESAQMSEQIYGKPLVVTTSGNKKILQSEACYVKQKVGSDY